MKRLALVPLLLIPAVVALALMAGLASGGTVQEYSIDVAVNVDDDPGGHAEFIDMPANIKLTIRISSGGKLNITGPSPWVGVRDDSFSTDLGGSAVTGGGFGTVAGIEDILVGFTGTFDPEHPDGPPSRASTKWASPDLLT